MLINQIITESQNKVSDIIDRIHEISYNDPSGWYLNGGCYAFAQALKISFGPEAETWTSSSADGEDIHAYTKYKNKFYDINGQHNSPDDVINSGDIYYEPPLKHNPNTNGDFDKKEVDKLVNQLLK